MIKPLIKRDNFNRVIYHRLNEVDRYLYRYYDDTDKKKIVIRLVGEEQIVEMFDRRNNVIYSNESGMNKINLGCIKIYNSKISIKLPINVRDEYLRFLKEKNKKYEPRPR